MVVAASRRIRFIEDETFSLVEWADSIHRDLTTTYFEKAQRIAHRLGANYRSDRLTEIGFWTPELAGDIIQSEHKLELEIFTPLDSIDFRAKEQQVRFRRSRIPVIKQGEYVWAVVYGLKAGTRDQAGCFYWLRYEDADGKVQIIRDPLAYSLPYGVFAPAELYDVRKLQKKRTDLAYFRHTGSSTNLSDITIPRLPAPTSILQIHVNTASAAGTLEGLTEIYQRISDKLADGQALAPEEAVYAGYDAIQLLPVEPTIEYRREDTQSEHQFFSIQATPPKITKVPLEAADTDFPEPEPDRAPLPHTFHSDFHRKPTITLRQPNTQNWGYDVPILGSSATNPAVLGSLRPDEVIDFIATLHNFSQGPIYLIYDLVYGHADNQALDLLNHQFLKGPNMYGQDLNHQSPQVRAILLEMQRRKINTGADGIRIDGGQDFRFFNPLTDRVEQDDTYLLAMSDLAQNIQGYRRLMFTIFEDGRPWPQEGWEEISRYRELIEKKPESFQWGPLIFAHNTPTLEGYWDKKWRRACEVIFQGNRWITGCGNHDTVRRGNQIDLDKPINWNLGSSLVEVLNTAYNNPATQIWVQGFCPGLPMDFLNATVGASWGFFRNTDDRYGVKIASEEIGFLDWQVSPEMYEKETSFVQIKKLGFTDLEQLRSFGKALQTAMIETDYDLEQVAKFCSHCLGEDHGFCEVPALEDLNEPNLPHFLATLDVVKLKRFAMAFMEDGHNLCKVSNFFDQIDPTIAAFNLALRHYRRSHPWLQDNILGCDRFNRISNDRHTTFYGLRCHPETRQQAIAMATHMGGTPCTVTLDKWLQLDMSQWKVVLATPGIPAEALQDLSAFELHDGQGVLLEPI
ncbi:alpha-amylase [cf. Phormidesmis sp. LEGE 11477]|nr:alpha-amylase [cf. Phormidesmis sp. LEGE 11477]